MRAGSNARLLPMLLILMYHRVYGVGRGEAALRQHLRSVITRYPVVLPGQRLEEGRLSVCLTFDDATVDFYHLVYPVLQELELTALVGVPTAFIEQRTTLNMAERLDRQSRHVMGADYKYGDSALCTWSELAEMQASGRVSCAGHGHYHGSMTDEETDVDAEVDQSFQTLERKLGVQPDAFIFPYGSANRRALQAVGRRFRYAMRIGGALNRNWGKPSEFLYRVDAEHFWPKGQRWPLQNMLLWSLKRRLNRLRGK
jgi:peptidoglycan/xylan/chitin deacetylase (PgdA/CDA1 family)